MSDKHIGLLDNGGVVVVVGGMARNFDEQYRANPRIVFWDSDDPRIKSKDLPTAARAVIMLPKFISHTTSESIVKQTRDRKLTLFNHTGTGEVKRTLDNLLAAPPKPEPVVPRGGTVLRHHSAVTPLKINEVPGASDEDLRVPKGALKAFVEKHMQMDGSHAEEARRLHPIAMREGLTTTLASLQKCIGDLRQAVTPPAPRPPMPPPTPPTPAPRPAVAPPTPAPAAPEPTARPRSSATDASAIEEALRMVDDTVAAMGLIRDTLVAAVDENRQLKQRLAKFKQLLEGIE